jgi:hypothetical protein
MRNATEAIGLYAEALEKADGASLRRERWTS